MLVFALLAATMTWVLAAKAWREPRVALILATTLWLLYAVFEVLIANAVLCGEKCNIRVDLILIWPLLMVATLYALKAPGEGIWGKVLGVIGFVIFLLFAAYLSAEFGGPATVERSTIGSPPSPR
jgi:hypothetical protein